MVFCYEVRMGVRFNSWWGRKKNGAWIDNVRENLYVGFIFLFNRFFGVK